MFLLVAEHARKNGALGRILKDLRHDWMATGLCRSARCNTRRYAQGAPVHHHVRSHTAQVAGIEALRSGEEAVQEMIREYDQRRRVIVDGLNSIDMPCVEPHGAFYAFPSIQNTSLSSEEFSEKLLFEHKVAVVPGTAFGDCGEGFVRCAYATSLVNIEEALGRMEDFVKRYHK